MKDAFMVDQESIEIENIPVEIKQQNGQITISVPELIIGSINYKLGMSVISAIHSSMLNVVEARTNKQGYENLLSFLPDTFSIKELSMIYAAIIGKPPSLPRTLANSLLDQYQQGTRKEKDGSVVPRIVFGRDMIEEVNEDDPDYKTLDDKRKAFKETFSNDYSKGGKKVTTLFRKKTPTEGE